MCVTELFVDLCEVTPAHGFCFLSEEGSVLPDGFINELEVQKVDSIKDSVENRVLVSET